MIELQEVEELFKSVNRNAIKAYLRNAAILKDPSATPEMKQLAEQNVKAIAQNKPIPKPKSDKPKKQKAVIETAAANPQLTPVQPAIDTATQIKAKPQFHEEFAQHHNLDPVSFKATWQAMTPEQQKITKEWHAQQLSQAPTKIIKSVDALYNLFIELKKHI